VDPGYKHGTKLAALSENGAVQELCTLHYTQPLATNTAAAAAASTGTSIEPAAKRRKADAAASANSSSSGSSDECLSEQQRTAVATLRRLLVEHSIGVVAVGNGTGTREAQALIAHAIAGLEGAEPGVFQ
jgi:transcriptional accessory protein Tex/SPT6